MKKNLLLPISLLALGLFAVQHLAITGTSARTFAGSDDEPDNSSGQYYPLSRPFYLYSTQPSVSACINSSALLTGGVARSIPTRVSCAASLIPANAIAVTGNLTVTNPTSNSGSISVYPGDDNPPVTVNSVYGPGQTFTNSFTVGLGSDGAFKVLASSSNIHVVVDINGYFAPPTGGGLYYHSLPNSTRLVNTRPDSSACFAPGAPLTGGAEYTQQASGTCSSIPATAKAIVGITTIINPSASGAIALYPAGDSSTTPTLNYSMNQTVSNTFTIELGDSGTFSFTSSATTDLIVDVNGYYSEEASDANGPGLMFRPTTPCRGVDTRGTVGELGGPPLVGGSTRSFPIRSSACGIPSTARSYSLNVTVVPSGPLNSLTLWPTGQPKPDNSILQSPNGQITTNAAIVPAGIGGAINTFSSDNTHVILDINGYFTPVAPVLSITGAELKGKKLEVSVGGLTTASFDAELASIEAQAKGPVILVDGVEQKASRIDATTLSSKKAGKKIKKLPSGSQVRLQVKDTDGRVSEEFIFVRP